MELDSPLWHPPIQQGTLRDYEDELINLDSHSWWSGCPEGMVENQNQKSGRAAESQ